MTALSAETVIPAAYSIDGRQLDAVYVSGVKGKPDGLYMPTRRAREIAGRSRATLNYCVANGEIRHIEWKGKRYLFMDDVKPDGYIYVDEAADASGYSATWLGRLATTEKIRKKYRCGWLLLWVADVYEYERRQNTKLPEGYIHLKVALKYASKPTLIKWAASGRVKTVRIPGGYGLLESDLIEATRPPEDSVTYAKASIEFGISTAHLSRLASRYGFKKTMVDRRVRLQRADIRSYVNGEWNDTVESKEAEELIETAAAPVSHRFALRGRNGRPTKFAEALFDRHAVDADNNADLVARMLEDLRERGNGHGNAEEVLRAMVEAFSKVG